MLRILSHGYYKCLLKLWEFLHKYHFTPSAVCYLASSLPTEGIHQLFNAVMCENRSVEEELRVEQFISVYEEAVGHQGVPVVELAELQRDTVTVLELGVKQQGGIKLQLQLVSTEVLHILLYHYLYGLT